MEAYVLCTAIRSTIRLFLQIQKFLRGFIRTYTDDRNKIALYEDYTTLKMDPKLEQKIN